jgi:hypothetical protein
MKLTANKLKNGALYFNTKTQNVERMLGTMNSNRVWTSAHEENPKATRCVNLRLATLSEVDGYLQASPKWNDVGVHAARARIQQRIKGQAIPSLPPLPSPVSA